MTNKNIENIISEIVTKIIENSSSDKKLKDLIKKHNEKPHFIPKNYRVFGGLLQSMNIQFGNFIELLMEYLIKNDGKYLVIDKFSGKKKNSFKLSKKNDELIDNYITNCQTKDEETFDIKVEFPKLLKSLSENKNGEMIYLDHDIDLLFEAKNTKKVYYLEIKYNDDHDTGKFVDINRKIIKTYAYLLNEFQDRDYIDIVPILFFFTNKKMKGNIYLPEATNIRRGKKFFQEFLDVEYDMIHNYLTDFSENSENIKKFEDLFEKIKNINENERKYMKLISWNVNGIRAAIKKGFLDYFNEQNADIFCLQETKLSAGQLDLELKGYHQYWNYAEKKGYSGTAIFTKQEPLSVSYGLGIEEHDKEGRVITLEFEKFYMVTVYTPNSKDELLRLDYRMVWEDEFRKYLKNLEKKKPIVVCGDLNVAHKEIDLKNPKTNRRNAGFTDEERGKFTELLDSGFIDTFRYFYPNLEQVYSWWSYRGRARENNAGWRIDYFVVSKGLEKNLVDAEIYSQIEGSDHCPVVLILDLNK